MENASSSTIVVLKSVRKTPKRNRKLNGLNKNRKGSVRKINGMVYIDFQYFDERVRESSTLPWNEKNAKSVREQLDRIHVAIHAGTFRFADVFTNSKKKDYFADKERRLNGYSLTPDQVKIGPYLEEWIELRRGSGSIAGRTLLGYKGLIRNYLKPFFQGNSFGDIDIVALDKFYSWARKQEYRGKEVSNSSLNKCVTVFKMVCKCAVTEYRWGGEFNPFHGYKKLPVKDSYEEILPFSVDEQNRLIEELPDHWKPYFKFAFYTGIRQGEQIGLKPSDIDWEKKVIHIRRGITLDENGKTMEGNTKNKYSRRSIKLLPVMLEALEEQKKIFDQCESPEYFFCTPKGERIHPSNLRKRVWIQALNKADLNIREMKQTRHSFATNTLSCGENPLWIATVLGHQNTEMIIKVYSKFVENANGNNDGKMFDGLYS